MFKKSTALFLCVLMVIFSLPVSVNASSSLTEAEFAAKIEELKIKYPDGKYWSGRNGTISDGPLAGSSLAGDLSCGSHYYSSNCGAFMLNGTALAWQCYGYAYLIAYEIFGSHAKTWSTYEDTDRQIYAGDLIRIDSNGNGIAESNYDHTIFVYRVTATHIYYTDCNQTGPCQINWEDGEMSFSELKSKFLYVHHLDGNTLTGSATSEPTLTVTYNANGGSIPTPETYRLTTDGYGLNLRSAPSTSAGRLTGMPDGIEIEITETLTSGGYIWGKTTYNGYNGWCALSKLSTDEVYAVPVGYYTESSVIYDYTTTMPYAQVFQVGVTLSEALADDEKFNLSRKGYTFAGWSLSADGSSALFDPDDNTLKPEDICPYAANESRSVVLFAVWAPMTHTFSYDANGGTGSMPPSAVLTDSHFTVPNNAFSYEGYAFDGWNIKRNTDGKWLSDGNGWCSEDELSVTSYDKLTINAGDVYLFNSSWLDENDACSYTLYAQWKKTEITGISVSRMPDKTLYMLGETFDPAGVEITVNYDNGTTETVTDGYYAECTFDSVGEVSVEITYKGFSSSVPVTVYKRPIISIGQADGYAGKTVSLPVDFVSDGENTIHPTALLFKILYDAEHLRYDGFTAADELGFESISVSADNGTIIIEYNGSKALIGECLLLNLRFVIGENASGEYEITADDIILSEGDIVYAASASSGKIDVQNSVPELVYGDATGDGLVDNKDLVRIKKYLAAYDYDTETSSVEISPGADATGDGTVDNKDLVRLKKYLASYDYDREESSVILGPSVD